MRAQITGFSALASLSLFLPALAGAVTLFDTLSVFSLLLNGLISVFIVLAVVAFFWGLIKYLFSTGGEAKEKGDAAKLMIWGVIILFVMVSIWGIIRLLQSTFQVTNTTAIAPGGLGVGMFGIGGGSGSGIQIGVQGTIPL
ncbi:MAG: hypothetical protein AAB830_00580 [Patescibacteria group bacterium]